MAESATTTPEQDQQAESQAGNAQREALLEKARQWEGQPSREEQRRQSTEPGDEGGQQAEPQDDGSSESDRSVAQDTNAQDAATGGTEAAEPSQQQTAGSDAQPDPDRLEKAKHALKRNQWADDDINALPTETILERGETLAQREAERNRVANDRSRLRQFVQEELGLDPDNPQQSLKQMIGGSESNTAADHKAEGSEQASTDASAIKSKLDQRIDESVTLGEDSVMDQSEVNSLRNGFKSIVHELVDHYESRLGSNGTNDNGHTDQQAPAEPGGESTSQQADGEPPSGLNDRWARQQENIAMDNAVIASGLIDQYDGQLKNSDTRAEVRERARKLVRGDEHGDLYYDDTGDPRWDKAMSDAAMLVVGHSDAGPQQQKADMLDRQRKQRASQPSFDNETGGTQKQMSAKDKMQALWEARQQNKSEAEIQRLRRNMG